jgi:tetratricopeptide (TPR) repeat protein
MDRSSHQLAPGVLRAGVTTRVGRCALAAILAGGLAGCQWTRASLQRDGEESQRLVEQARHAVLAGDLKQADSLLDRAGIVCPDDPAVPCQRADLLRAHGDVQGAVSQLRIAAARDPENAETFARLADLLLEQDRVGEADVAATSALAIDPRHPEALEIKAAVAERRRRDDLALEMYYRLLTDSSGDAQAKLRIAAIELRCGRPERAAPLLREVSRSTQAGERERGEARWFLGIAYGAEGRWADAVRELAAAASRRGTMTADDWYRLAYARTQAGDTDGAREELDRVFGMQPEHGPAIAMRSALRSHSSTQSRRTPGGHSFSGFPPPEGWPLPEVAEATASLGGQFHP